MQELILHAISEIHDGTEELWITSECSIIHLSIHISTGMVSGFSCRLGPGVVVDMGKARDALTNSTYPAFCIFTEDENGTSPPRYCQKRGTEWLIET